MIVGSLYSSSYLIRVFKIIGISRPHVLNVHVLSASTLNFESGILELASIALVMTKIVLYKMSVIACKEKK
jgi:hypothetical protein